MQSIRYTLSSLVLLSVVTWTEQANTEEVSIAVGEWPPYLSAELKHNGAVAHLISDIFLEEGFKARFTFPGEEPTKKQLAEFMT